MFFRKAQTTDAASEVSDCEDNAAYFQAIAFEKCRKQRVPVHFLDAQANKDRYLWSENDCKQASQTVVEQFEKCLSLKHKASPV